MKHITFLTFERKPENKEGYTPEVITLDFKTYPSLWQIEEALKARASVYVMRSEWYLIKVEQVGAS